MELNLLLNLLLYGHLYITCSGGCVVTPRPSAQTTTKVKNSELPHVSQDENGMAALHCGRLTNGTVTWSRDVDGQRVDILTTHNGEMTKHICDPDKRYNSGANLVLYIRRVSQSDAGKYYCNGTTVELSVRPVRPSPPKNITKEDSVTRRSSPPTNMQEENSGEVRLVEKVLKFSGVGLAGLVFLLTTVTAGRAIHHQAWLVGYETGRDEVQLSTE